MNSWRERDPRRDKAELWKRIIGTRSVRTICIHFAPYVLNGLSTDQQMISKTVSEINRDTDKVTSIFFFSIADYIRIRQRAVETSERFSEIQLSQ